MTRSMTLAVLAVAAFALAGCTQPSSGSPTASATSAASSSGSATGGTLASRDPCTLLTSADITQIGLPAGQKNDVGGARNCDWTVSGDNGYHLSIGIRDTQGIKDINTSQGGQLSSLPVGKHDAQLLQQPRNSPGGCMVIIGVTSSSRVDIDVRADATAPACQTAKQIAAKVEPHLP